MGTPCVNRNILVASTNNNGGIASDSGFLYVTNNYNVYKLDKVTGSVVANVSVGVGIITNAITVDANYVWVTSSVSNKVFIINKDTACFNSQEIIGTFNSPVAIHSDGTYAWVVNEINNILTRITVPAAPLGCVIPVILAPAEIDLGSSYPGSSITQVFSDAVGNVWVSSVNNGGNNNNVFQCNVNGTPAAYPFYPVGTAPEGIYSDGTHVWIANTGTNDVTKYLIDGSISDKSANRTDIPTGQHTYNITYDTTGGLWVSNFESNTVQRIDAVTDSVGVPVVVGTYPYGLASDSDYVWCAPGNFIRNTIAEIKIAGGCGSGGDPYVTTISNIRYKLPALDAPIRFYQGVVDGKLLTINAQLRTTPNADMTAENLRSYFEYKHKVPAHKRKELEYAVYAKEDLCFYEKFYISYNDSELVVNVWEPKFKFESYKGKVVSETSTRGDLIARCTGAYDHYATNTLKFTFGSANLYISVYPNRLVRSSIYLEAPAMSKGNGVIVNTLSVRHMTLGALNSQESVPKKDSAMKEKEEWFLDHVDYRTRKFYMAR